MKKVLIISYFFPPNNYTSANRVYGFAKYLKESGFYPIIVTRNWDIDIQNTTDLSKPSGEKVKHQKFDNYEVFYLPFKGSFRDKFFLKFGTKLKFIRRILSFFELILENISLLFLPHSNLFYKAKGLIEKNNINYLIISASPFNQFYYGFLLKKKFPNLKWLADYRDEWTSRSLIVPKHLVHKIVLNLQARNEKKWLTVADVITSVSSVISKNISKHINNNSFATIENGFFEEDFKSINNFQNNNFIITYTGEIYEKQDFSIFLEAVKKIIIKYEGIIKIQIRFIGLKNNLPMLNYIKKIMSSHENNLIFTSRVSRIESVKLENQSNLLLMVAYGELKGIPSSKLYQYIGSRKQVFVCPSDNDIIEYSLKKTKQGVFANNSVEAFLKLEYIIDEYLVGKENIKINTSEISKYSRKHQTKKLAKILDSL